MTTATKLLVTAGLLLGTTTAMAQVNAKTNSQFNTPAGTTPTAQNAQTSTQMGNAPIADRTSTATMTQADRDFLKKDAQGSEFELQLSQLAVEKASSSAIRDFARRDVADHATMTKAGEQLAQAAGMTGTPTLTADQQAQVTKLRAMSGPSFDRAYIDAMKSINKADKEEFASESQRTQNPMVKQFVQQAQAMDREHEAMVDKLR